MSNGIMMFYTILLFVIVQAEIILLVREYRKRFVNIDNTFRELHLITDAIDDIDSRLQNTHLMVGGTIDTRMGTYSRQINERVEKAEETVRDLERKQVFLIRENQRVRQEIARLEAADPEQPGPEAVPGQQEDGRFQGLAGGRPGGEEGA